MTSYGNESIAASERERWPALHMRWKSLAMIVAVLVVGCGPDDNAVLAEKERRDADVLSPRIALRETLDFDQIGHEFIGELNARRTFDGWDLLSAKYAVQWDWKVGCADCLPQAGDWTVILEPLDGPPATLTFVISTSALKRSPAAQRVPSATRGVECNFSLTRTESRTVARLQACKAEELFDVQI